MSNELNAKQIMRFTAKQIHAGASDVKLLKLLHEYARYFPMARITKAQINSPKAIHTYMFSHDLGVDKRKKTDLKSL